MSVLCFFGVLYNFDPIAEASAPLILIMPIPASDIAVAIAAIVSVCKWSCVRAMAVMPLFLKGN